MKFILFAPVLILGLMMSCNQKAIDEVKASTFIEEYINKTGSGDFSNFSTYYSEEMKNGEDEKTREYKIQQINDALGKVESFEKISSNKDVMDDGQNALTMIYKIKHNLMTVRETYTVKEENGSLKIAKQEIESVQK